MRYKIFYIIFCFLFITSFSFAQQLTIQGTVQDTTTQTPLQYAVAMTIRLNDSLLTSFTRTDSKGFFKMGNLPVDTYQVILSHPRFGEQSFIILGNKNDSVVDFKKIILPPKSVSMQEVTIYGYKDAVYYKGDTLVYTADSFKVKQNAVVEDLLKKLPGIKVDAEGKIYSQGTAVDQVLVDGDEFFGADPTIATKNLNANTLESVQVYDKKNENATDNSDKETLKVMNLQLKEDAKKGYFGKVSGASDFNKFYEGDVLVNKFKGSQKISVFALTSNTPRSQFDWNDMWKYGLNNEMNMQSGDDGMMYYYNSSNQQKGIPKTFKSGFYFTDKIGKKLKISSNYSYTTANVDAETGTGSQYFLEDTTYSTDKLNTSFQRSEAHSMSLTVNYTIDSLTELEVQPRYKYNTGNRNSFETNKFLTSENILSRTSSIETNNSSSGNDFSNGIKVTRNFKKRDRKITTNYNFSLQDSKSDGKLISDNEYYLSPQTDVDINQQKKNTNEKQSHRASLSYTEPLSKKIKLEFSYDYTLSLGEQNKSTFDFANGNYETPNTELSNNFRTNRIINRAGIRFGYEVKKQSLGIGTRARQVTAKNTDLVANTSISQTVNNLLPYLMYRYKFSDNHSINFRYNTDSRQPDLNQLQPVPDNSNPNNVSLGNPDLLPTFSHGLNVNYNKYKPISGKSAWGGLTFNAVQNDFANSISYDSIGRTTTQPINVDGNYNGNGYMSMSFPFFDKVLEINPGADFNFSNRSNYINSRKNKTLNAGGNVELDIGIEKEKIEFRIGGSYGYNYTKSTLSEESNKPYSDYSFSSSLEIELPKKFKFKTDAEYTINQQRAAAYNINYIIWNASIGKTFLKNENLILSVDAYDILNQNINTYREVNDNVISDIRTTIIGRYILFRVTFKFNSNKEKEEGDD